VPLSHVSLRSETEQDRSFLEELFIATREEWPGFRDLAPASRSRILKEQFHIQHQQYKQYPHTWFNIISVDDQPVGRIYVCQNPMELRVIDLSLLPQYRQHGIGTQLLRSIQAEATRTQLPLRLQVHQFNSARHFYQKLGFQEESRNSSHVQLMWSAAQHKGPLVGQL